MTDRSSLPQRLRDRADALRSGVRFGQFLSVGVLGAIFDFLVLTALVEAGGLPAELAKLASAETAIVVMFVANERWTFADWGRRGVRPLASRFLRSNVVRAGGAGVAWIVLVVLVRTAGVHYLVANAAGIGVGFLVNYVLESVVTWRVHVG